MNVTKVVLLFSHCFCDSYITCKHHTFLFLYFVLVPTTYGLSLIAHHVQIVGQSLTLECSVTTVRGITSIVKFIWRSNGAVLKEEEINTQNFTVQNLNIYSNTYTISQLSTTNDDKTYQCEVVIDASPPITEYSNVTLDITGMVTMLQYT